MKYNVLMKKARALLILGTWVTILPYLGFPYSWKDVLTTITGLGLMVLSYILYIDYKKTEETKGQKKTFDSFKENDNFNENEIEVGAEEMVENQPENTNLN